MKLDRGILVIAAIAIAARLVFALAFPTGGGDWDIYETVAENIIRGCGVSLSPPGGSECIPHYGGNHLPGYPAFVALVWSVSAHSDMAVRVAQILLYALALGRLVAAAELYSGSRRAALVIGVVMALSPLQIAWPRYTQTETLSLAAVVWTFAEILASLAERRLRVVPLGLAIVAATFIRLDGILLCIPAAITGFILHRPVVAIRRGAVAALIVVLPIAGWTVRNAVLGVNLVPLGMVLPKNAPTPYGYIAWGATWVSEEYQRVGWAWPVNRMKHAGITIDNKAYDSRAERDMVEGWLKELAQYQDESFPPELDRRFAELARERSQRAPLRTYLWLPAERALALWKNPFSSFGWPNELPAVSGQERVDAVRGGGALVDLARRYPVQAVTKALTAGYRFILLGAFIVAVGLSLRRKHAEIRPVVWIVVTWVVTRTLFFAVTNNVETRYTAPTIPALEIVVVLAAFSVASRRRRFGSGESQGAGRL